MLLFIIVGLYMLAKTSLLVILALSKNDTIQTYANNAPDDPQKLTVYSHYNYSGFDYDLHTTTYFRGQKINPAHIPGIKSMLILQSKPIGKVNNPVLLPLK